MARLFDPNLNHGQDTRANRTRHTSSSTQSHAKQRHTNAAQAHLTFTRDSLIGLVSETKKLLREKWPILRAENPHMQVMQDILTHLSWSLALAGRKALAGKDRAGTEAAARDRSTPPPKPAQPALFQHVWVISIGAIFIFKLSSISDKVGGEGIELARELFFASKRYAVEDEASRGVAAAVMGAAIMGAIRWRRSTSVGAATPVKEAMKSFMVIYLGVLFVGLLAASFLPANRTATIHVVPLLTSKECDAIVSAAEQVTSKTGRGWDTGRHRHYATEDVPLSEVPRATAILAAHLEAELYPFISSHFCGSPTACNITLRDGFIVRYLPERQPSLDMHRDGHHVSFNLALSTPSIDFSGGGTGFKRLQEAEEGIIPPPKGHRIIHPPIIHNPKGHRIIHTPKGHALVHGGAVEHSGEAITAGSRYLVVGFLQVERFGRGAWGHRLARLWGGLASEVRMAPPPTAAPARTSGWYERLQ